VAAKRGNLAIFEALLSFGASMEDKDLLGRDAPKLMKKFLKKNYDK
jgi:hypothetical protein